MNSKLPSKSCFQEPRLELQFSFVRHQGQIKPHTYSSRSELASQARPKDISPFKCPPSTSAPPVPVSWASKCPPLTHVPGRVVTTRGPAKSPTHQLPPAGGTLPSPPTPLHAIFGGWQGAGGQGCPLSCQRLRGTLCSEVITAIRLHN